MLVIRIDRILIKIFNRTLNEKIPQPGLSPLTGAGMRQNAEFSPT